MQPPSSQSMNRHPSPAFQQRVLPPRATTAPVTVVVPAGAAVQVHSVHGNTMRVLAAPAAMGQLQEGLLSTDSKEVKKRTPMAHESWRTCWGFLEAEGRLTFTRKIVLFVIIGGTAFLFIRKSMSLSWERNWFLDILALAPYVARQLFEKKCCKPFLERRDGDQLGLHDLLRKPAYSVSEVSERLKLSSCTIRLAMLTRLCLFHLMQPLVYVRVLLYFWTAFTTLQKVLGIVFLLREFIYFLASLIGTCVNPAFLVCGPALRGAERTGFVFCPEKIVISFALGPLVGTTIGDTDAGIQVQPWTAAVLQFCTLCDWCAFAACGVAFLGDRVPVSLAICYGAVVVGLPLSVMWNANLRKM